MTFLVPFVISVILAALLIPIVKRAAFAVGAVDRPSADDRKIHKRVMARGGGVAIYLSFVVVTIAFLPNYSLQFAGLLVAGTIVLLVGLVDDIHRLSPWIKLFFQILAAIIATVGFKIGIDVVTNPFGGVVDLNRLIWQFSFNGLNLSINLLGSFLAVVWLVGMTNTINFLDGLDGLSGGVAGIAAMVMFFLSVSPRVGQPATALISIVLAGATLGYLIYNFYPAKIFNGDSGAYFLGMTLGILAIMSGAKLATALLVLGLPIIDALWTVLRRILAGRSPFSADRGHLHFLLLDAGLTQRQAVLIIYSFSVFFGSMALFTSTNQKVLAIFCMVIMMIFLIGILELLKYRRTNGRGRQKSKA